MATYKQIQKYILEEMQVRNIKTCYIAHAKELLGLPVRRSPRREGERKIKCPNGKLNLIDAAFRHFRMI